MTKKLTLRERIAITRRGFGLLSKYCPGLVQGKALAALVSSLQPFAAIWFSAQIIGELSGARSLRLIVIYAAAVVLVNFTASLIRNTLDKVNSAKESQMWHSFGKVFADKQMSADFVDLENAEIQHQRKRAEENLYMFGNGLAQLVWGTSGLVENIVSILVSVSMTVTLFIQQSGNPVIDHPLWALALLFGISLCGVCNARAVVHENRVFEDWCKGTVWFNRMAMLFGRELYISSDRAKDLRIYRQSFIADRMLKRLLKSDMDTDRQILKMSLYPAVAGIVIGIGNALCYIFVVLKAFYGAFGIGSMVQYVGVLSRLGEGVQGLLFVLADNAVYCKHLQALYDYLDIPNKKYEGTLPVEKRAFCDGGDNLYEIEFRDVSFRYPNTDTYALRHVSICFRIGERLAVVGQNGSGKTTFIKLLCRLYDPDEGEILLNGINIQKYDYDEYLSLFSIVFQDFKLFSFSLAQNVAASVYYDRSRVESCLMEAGFGNRLHTLSDGVETYLYKDFEESGVEISGGEAQKIALARALYKNAPLIVLDEPTAALDPVAEYEIYSKFSRIVGDKTAIYISHRLSSCRFCDDIIVFDHGEIVQHGSHDILLTDRDGKYHTLWFTQAQYYQ
ncbi:MAG: ABC transporter ATP-binding protein [Clostridiaceae bacterium]|nr:ABC transporter ATP-binding protein [Clostridiaceae bacterium]